MTGNEDGQPVRHALRRWLMALLALGLAAVIAALAVDIGRKLDAIAAAASDNILWSVSQTDVELYALETAVLRAVDDPPTATLDDVRLRFNIFFSRVATLRESPAFAPLRNDPRFTPTIAQLSDFLDSRTALIDGPNAALRQALPALGDEARNLRPVVRTLVVDSLQVFSEDTQMRRSEIARTLTTAALMTVLMVSVLIVGAAALNRLNRLLEDRARDLRRTARRLQTVIASSLDPLIVTGKDDRIVEFNPAAEHIFGVSRAEALGQRFEDLARPRGDALAEAASREGLIRLDLTRRDGSRFPAEMARQVAHGDEGEILSYFVRDITQRVANETALREARDRAVGGERAKARIIAVLSHEMRTPLNGLIGTLDLLRDSPLTDDQMHYLEIMSGSAQLMLHHVNDVLEAAQLDAGAITLQSAPFDLVALTQEVAHRLAPEADSQGSQIQCDTDDAGLRQVVGDPRRIEQVLLNLVGNAVKFTRDGRIWIETEALSDREMVEIRVYDTGCGIAEDDQERIFDDFVKLGAPYSRSGPGTGLGLGIVRRMVRAMGGEIGVESEPGEGSLFWVRLPLQRAPGASFEAAVPDTEEAEPMPGPRHVLLAEDNPANRFVARRLLEHLGHEVDEAVDGLDAVERAADTRYDVILMDISMPRLDGLGAARRIREGEGASRQTPIIATTAHALPEEIDAFLEAGMTDVLVKPVTAQAIGDVLGRRTAPRSGPAPRPLHPVDPEVLADLLRTAGQDGTQRLFRRFEDEVAAFLSDFETLSDADLRRSAHRLAGTAAMMGGRALNARLARIDRTGRGKGDRAALTMLWQDLRAIYEARLEPVAG